MGDILSRDNRKKTANQNARLKAHVETQAARINDGLANLQSVYDTIIGELFSSADFKASDIFGDIATDGADLLARLGRMKVYIEGELPAVKLAKIPKRFTVTPSGDSVTVIEAPEEVVSNG